MDNEPGDGWLIMKISFALVALYFALRAVVLHTGVEVDTKPTKRVRSCAV